MTFTFLSYVLPFPFSKIPFRFNIFKTSMRLQPISLFSEMNEENEVVLTYTLFSFVKQSGTINVPPSVFINSFMRFFKNSCSFSKTSSFVTLSDVSSISSGSFVKRLSISRFMIFKSSSQNVAA